MEGGRHVTCPFSKPFVPTQNIEHASKRIPKP
jgi:hypothetical protein